VNSVSAVDHSEGDRAAGSIADAIGAERTVEEVVTETMTARAVGCGDVAVLATPMVLALAERAAVAALEGWLPPGQTTVGVSVELQHLAPTPVGVPIRATASLLSVEARRLVFSFVVVDAAGEVARGTHTRIQVDRARFMAAAQARVESH